MTTKRQAKRHQRMIAKEQRRKYRKMAEHAKDVAKTRKVLAAPYGQPSSPRPNNLAVISLAAFLLGAAHRD